MIAYDESVTEKWEVKNESTERGVRYSGGRGSLLGGTARATISRPDLLDCLVFIVNVSARTRYKSLHPLTWVSSWLQWLGSQLETLTPQQVNRLLCRRISYTCTITFPLSPSQRKLSHCCIISDCCRFTPPSDHPSQRLCCCKYLLLPFDIVAACLAETLCLHPCFSFWCKSITYIIIYRMLHTNSRSSL